MHRNILINTSILAQVIKDGKIGFAGLLFVIQGYKKFEFLAINYAILGIKIPNQGRELLYETRQHNLIPFQSAC